MRGRWCNIIVLNVHAKSEEKSDESKDSFYEELEQVFDQGTIIFSMEKETKITSWEQDFLYTKE